MGAKFDFTFQRVYLIATLLCFSIFLSAQTYSGNIFLDHNSDGIKNFLDYDHPVITISGYDDTNGSGDFDSGDLLMESTNSDVSGNYSLTLDAGITSRSKSVVIKRGSDDAEEYTVDDRMYLNSSDLELGFEGGSEQVVGMRFDKINIPAGVTVTNAYVRFQSKTFEDNTCNLTFKGELSTSSATFNSMDANLSSRTPTVDSVNWTPSDWDGSSFYNSPNLSLFINELIAQPGWTASSPITIITTGTGERTAWSDDGSGTAPELVIQYSVNYTGNDFFIVLENNNLLPGAAITLPATVEYEYSASAGNQSNVDFAFYGETIYCYGFSDDDVDAGLSIMNRVTGEELFIGLSGETQVEAAAFDPMNEILYAADPNQLGVIDRTTGAFTARPNSAGTGSHTTEGSQNFSDIDGLSFDPFNGVLWASERNNDTLDILFQLDAITGLFVPDVFGPGNDYVYIDDATGTIPEDIDDIAIHPKTGELFAIANDGDNFAYDLLITINKTTGLAILVDTLKDATGQYITDVEGLAFIPSGILSAVTGDDHYDANSVFNIDPLTAVGDYIGTYGTGDDYESCDCMTISTNSASGTVWNDLNGDQVIDGGENGYQNVTVYIYVDRDNSGTINGPDMLADSVETDVNGDWNYQVGANVDLLFVIDEGDLPLGEILTTDNLEIALLNSIVGGTTEADNNFGSRDAALPVTLTSFSANADDCDINVSWSAFVEDKFDYYDLERSDDGSNYDRIYSAFGQHQNGLKTYDYKDRLGSLVNYYRLKMVDLDGSVAYSDAVIIRLDCEKFTKITIYPNPIQVEEELINIEYFAAESVARFMVTDILGKNIRQFEFSALANANNRAQIDISQLPAGTYSLMQAGNRQGQLFVVTK